MYDKKQQFGAESKKRNETANSRVFKLVDRCALRKEEAVC